MTTTKNITLEQVREAAGPHVEVWDDVSGECYRATCKPGYCFDQPTQNFPGSGLHEFVAYYGGFANVMAGVSRRDARADLLSRFSGRCGAKSEPCEGHARGDCDWCDEAS